MREHPAPAARVRKRVLVADDNLDIQDLLCELFIDQGFDVVRASDGVEAIRRTAEARPDLVLLDMRMPRADGLNVLMRIRETDLDTAIVLHTAFGNDSIALEALRGGADDYLKKPVNLDMLLERVNAVLIAKEGHNALRHRAEMRVRESEELYRQTAAELAARVATIEVTQDVARSVLSNLDLRTLAETLVTKWQRLIPYESASLALYDDDGTGATRLAAIDDKPFDIGPRVGDHFQLDKSLFLSIARESSELVIVDDLRLHPDLRPIDRSGVASGLRSLLVLPIPARDRMVGVMLLGARVPSFFTERHAAVARELVAPTGIAIQNALLYRDLGESYANLERAQEELLRQERLAALGQIGAVMAHELRNPLAVIFNSLGPLRQLLRPEGDVAMLLTIIEEESDRLNRIVGSLLDYARPTTLEPSEGNLTALLQDVLRDASTDPAYHSGIDVVTQYGHRDGPFVFDEHLLRQALINLLQNAYQAIKDEGEVHIATADVVFDGRPSVRIGITDNGAGIRPEIRDRIFDPFFTTRVTGTGLGLPIVKRVIEDHHGRLDLESKLGVGTTFTVTIPRGTP